MKLLIVDDNYRLAERMKAALQKHLIVEIAHSADQALGLTQDTSFDIAILDLNLPDMHGLELCTLLRKQSLNIPILIVSGIDTTSSRVDLLQAGADDYITKPFETAELTARIQALLRRAERSENNPVLSIDTLTVDTNSPPLHAKINPSHYEERNLTYSSISAETRVAS